MKSEKSCASFAELSKTIGLNAASFPQEIEQVYASSRSHRAAASEFLAPRYVKRQYARIGSPVDTENALCACAARILGEPPLLDYFTLLSYDFYYASEHKIEGWRLRPAERLGEENGLFSLLVAMTSLPLASAAYQSLGLPEKYADATALWVGGTIQNYAAAHGGRPGHDLSQSFWLRLPNEGRLFRVGRFEFLLEKEIPDSLPAIFRRKCDGAVLALARDGWTFDRDGFRLARDGKDTPYFTACFREDDSCISGTPISPRGFASAPSVTLKKRDWLRCDDTKKQLLSLHIPGGGGMTPAATRFSLQKALRFFPKYLHREVGLIFTCSWLLDPVLEERLPNSNLAEFQKQCYLFPCEHNRVGDLFFVFGRRDAENWREFPEDNSLRHVILDTLRSGRPYRNGGMFLLPEEIADFGSAPYRSRDPLAAR